MLGKSPRKPPGAEQESARTEGGGEHHQKYSKFLEQRIEELTEENKRYLAKYADLRAFAYNQIESLVKRQNAAAGRR